MKIEISYKQKVLQMAGIVIAMSIIDEKKRFMLTLLCRRTTLRSFLILPVFAFANAKLTFIGLDVSMLYWTY